MEFGKNSRKYIKMPIKIIPKGNHPLLSTTYAFRKLACTSNFRSINWFTHLVFWTNKTHHACTFFVFYAKQIQLNPNLIPNNLRLFTKKELIFFWYLKELNWCYLASYQPTLAHRPSNSLTKMISITIFHSFFRLKVIRNLIMRLGPQTEPSA